MNHKCWRVGVLLVVCLAGSPARAKDAGDQEKRLIEILVGPAGRAEKDKACRTLRRIGTAGAVPALAALLPDKDLSHMARYALEAMPYPAAGRALRDALGKTSGMVKVGVIGSLGVRADEQAVPALIPLLKDADAAIAAAAAHALGRIGTPAAARALDQFRARAPQALQPAAAEASLIAAERLIARGESQRAAAIYEALQAPKWPMHVRAGALAGSLAAGSTVDTARLAKLLAGDEAMLRRVAIAAVAGMKGPGATKRIAAELPKLPAEAQVLLIAALAERGDPAAGPAIAAAAVGEDPRVRSAAVKALGAVGDVTCVAVLCKAVIEGTSDADKKVAVESLRRLGGDGVDTALVKLMKSAPRGARPELIKALAGRQATVAVPDLLAEAAGPDDRVRRAALKALGALARPKDLSALLGLLVRQKGQATRKDAERAVVQVSRQIPDRTSRADPTLGALAKTRAAPAKCSLLRVLGGIANVKAFEAVRAALTDSDAAVQDTAVRALADWPDPQAADTLLGVFRTTGSRAHRVVALRGCVRLLGLAGRPAGETVKAYGELAAGAPRPEEKKLVLAGLAKVGDPAALKAVEPFLADAAVRAEAELALLRIARLLMAAQPEAAKEAASKLRAKSKSEAVRRQAAEIIRHIEKFGDYIVAWQVAGPYSKRGRSGRQLFDVRFGPEKAGRDAKWRVLPVHSRTDKPWMVDLAGSVGGNECAAYVRTWVHSERARRARLDMGVDDAVKVWLNGKLVHGNNSSGEAVPGEEKANVSLKQGWNVLMLKVVQHTGPWEFCARLRAPSGGPLGGLIVDSARGGPGAAKPAVLVAKGPWRPLFNGRDLAGWRKTGTAVFGVQDGCLVGTQTDGKGGDLWSQADFDDFELRVTYRVVWPANSGFWFRFDLKKGKGYQYDVLKWPKPVAFSGTLYCPGKMFLTRNLTESLENRDGWNEARVRAAGDELTLWLNGTKTGTVRDKTLRSGKIGIQVHGGNQFKGMKITIKKMEVRSLAAGERE